MLKTGSTCGLRSWEHCIKCIPEQVSISCFRESVGKWDSCDVQIVRTAEVHETVVNKSFANFIDDTVG